MKVDKQRNRDREGLAKRERTITREEARQKKRERKIEGGNERDKLRLRQIKKEKENSIFKRWLRVGDLYLLLPLNR